MIDLDFGKTLLTIIMIKLGHDLNTLFISRIQVDLYVLNAAARKYLICCTMFVDLYTWFHLLLVSSIEREIFHKPVFLPKCISKMARFVCVMCTVSLSKKFILLHKIYPWKVASYGPVLVGCVLSTLCGMVIWHIFVEFNLSPFVRCTIITPIGNNPNTRGAATSSVRKQSKWCRQPTNVSAALGYSQDKSSCNVRSGRMAMD